MKLKNHFILIIIVMVAWFVFYLVGMPSNYFQDWSTAEQIELTIITIFAIVPLISFITMVFMGQDYVKTGIWLAFYASIPLFIFDYIFVGIIKGEGLHFFVTHWYLTLGYLYVWIIGPLLGYSLEKFKAQIKNNEVISRSV